MTYISCIESKIIDLEESRTEISPKTLYNLIKVAYSTEPETVARMNAFADEHGYVMQGKHHEIYMGNPLQAAPEKLKTILRHAVQKR